MADEPGAVSGMAVTIRMPPPWGRWWWTRLFLIQWFMTFSQAENKRHDTAWIVVRNRRGDEYDLFPASIPEAEEKRERLDRELHEMPLDQWCEPYGVPIEFTDPPSAGVL